MTIALVQDMTDMTPESHDAYEEYLHILDDPPAGLILYAAGSLRETQFRVIEIWESKAAQDAIYQDRVGPATDRYLGDGGTPLDDIQESHVTLHALYRRP